MDPQKADAAGATAEKLGGRERAALGTEKDPATVAALVRGLGTITDPATAASVVDLFERDHPLVRETVLVALMNITDDLVRDAAWKHGLAHKEPMARAYTARLCAAKGVVAAIPQLRTQLADANWYARAEAALALGTLRDVDSVTKLLPLVDDPAGKARVAAMDALGMLGEKAEMAVVPISKHLSGSHWQHRIAAAQSLGNIGSMEGVEPLIARMETESGRLRRDIEVALAKITRDDLGLRPEYWRAWWEKQKAANGGRIPGRPADPGAKAADRPDPNAAYAKPDYFGIELYCNRVAFVIDVSGSMQLRFVPNAADQARRARPLRGSNKIEMCKSEVSDALQTLDQRSHFNVVAFADKVDPWKKNPVPASKGNVDEAISWVQNRVSGGETNYYDALRAVLDVGDRPDSSSEFDDTPDTITFLTDGEPTQGEILDADVLVEWYTGLNRYARVRTHTITFGLTNVDTALLKAMADRNGGRFTLVAERKAPPGK
jgi:hypothetical protein